VAVLLPISQLFDLRLEELVGPLPQEIAYVNGYAGAVAKDAAAEPAKAFLAFLTGAESKACFGRYGLG